MEKMQASSSFQRVMLKSTPNPNGRKFMRASQCAQTSINQLPFEPGLTCTRVSAMMWSAPLSRNPNSRSTMPLTSCTASAIRPTAQTASRPKAGLMSRAYSVSSLTMSYTLDEQAMWDSTCTHTQIEVHQNSGTAYHRSQSSFHLRSVGQVAENNAFCAA